MKNGNRAEGDEVERQSRKQPASGKDAPTDDDFGHSAGADLGSVLDTYARPDRRVLDRRSRTPEPSPPGANERRTLDRRLPSPDPSSDDANDEHDLP